VSKAEARKAAEERGRLSRVKGCHDAATRALRLGDLEAAAVAYERALEEIK